MTTENEIIYSKGLDLNRITQEPIPLQKSEVIDDKSDLHISIKMVDEDGETLLLIEAGPCCMREDEPNKNIQGCYIRRFEFVKQFFTNPYYTLLQKFLTAFVTRVRFNMTPTNNGRYLTNYQYVWDEKADGVECIIATKLGLPPILTIQGIVVYKDILPQ